MDDIEWYEIDALLRYEHYAHKDGWEQARIISNILINCHSKRAVSLTDTLPFYWEKEKCETSVTNEDIERMRAQAAEYIKNQG